MSPNCANVGVSRKMSSILGGSPAPDAAGAPGALPKSDDLLLLQGRAEKRVSRTTPCREDEQPHSRGPGQLPRWQVQRGTRFLPTKGAVGDRTALRLGLASPPAQGRVSESPGVMFLGNIPTTNARMSGTLTARTLTIGSNRLKPPGGSASCRSWGSGASSTATIRRRC